MAGGRRPVSFPFVVLFNCLAWLIFWLFIEPLGAWLSRVLWQVWRGIGWLPMGLVMLAYNFFR